MSLSVSNATITLDQIKQARAQDNQDNPLHKVLRSQDEDLTVLQQQVQAACASRL